MKQARWLIGVVAGIVMAGPAMAQGIPRISALYPPGARAGATVDVAVRAGGLAGAKAVLVDGEGVSATIKPSDVKINPQERELFVAKCSLCHDLRGPENMSRTAAQWVATVNRMIQDRSAPIEPAERDKIHNYMRAAAAAAEGLTAQITVAADAKPGRREIRIVGASGTSTVFPFEVSDMLEVLDVEPNNEPDKPQLVRLPVIINGQIASGQDVDRYAFAAKKGERLVFNLSAYRLNPLSQGFFFPVLYLYDQEGKELARNTGYFGLDPLIDFTVPEDGQYTILVRDMLYRGSPASVYRLSMGALPYETYLFPAGGKRGATVQARLGGKNLQESIVPVTLPGDAAPGVRIVSTPQGSFPFAVGEYEEFIESDVAEKQSVKLPATLNGRIRTTGEVDRYHFTLSKEELGSYTFTVAAEPLGSPLYGRLTLRNASGQALASNEGIPGTRDPRVDYNFREPGEYVLEVSDHRGGYGDAYVYRVTAGPSEPDFQVVLLPDNPNVAPGSSVYVSVRLVRRLGFNSDVTVTFENLPKGVTASPVVLTPSTPQGFTVLTADKDAQGGVAVPVRVIARAQVGGKTLTREVVPQEAYRINNNVRTETRPNFVVTVTEGVPPWRVTLTPSSMSMSPESGPIEVTVRVERTGAGGNLPFAVVGLPNGVQGPRSVLFKPGEQEQKITLTPTRGGVFTMQNPPSRFLLALVNGEEGNDMQLASVPAVVSITPAAR